MHNYENFELNDFILDDFFCKWVLSPTLESNHFWEKWLEEYPYKKDLIDEARSSVYELRKISDHQVSQHLLNTSFDEIMNQTKIKQLPTRSSFNWYNRVAAAIALLIICGILYYIESDKKEVAIINQSVDANLINYTNESESVQRIELSDGSVLTLEPMAEVKYPQEFLDETRTVILEGEAFFEIAEDSLKPFYVLANETVIRVLGTSFLVKANEDDEDVEVVVRTGKVAVYKQNEIQKAQATKQFKAKPLIVTPNQKVVFKRKAQEMTKRLTVAPTLLKPLDQQERRKFEGVQVWEILEALELAYGVEIQLAPDATIDCTITTTLTNQTLFEKLDIICAPLGLKYHEKDAKIIVTGSCP